MRRKLSLVGLVSAVVLVGTLAIAGPSSARSGGVSKDAGTESSTLWKTFSTGVQGGTSATVSTDGNVTSFTSPSGYQHIFAEGYALAYNGLCAYNYANTVGGSSVGFGASTQGTSNVIINTSDGLLQLNQTFAFQASYRQLQISIAVKNLSASTVTGVSFIRTADLDMDGSLGGDWHDATADAYTARQVHGLSLREISVSSGVTYTGAVTTVGDGLDCSYTPVVGPVNGDYAGLVAFNIGNLAAGKTKTVKVAYLRY